MVGIPYPEPGDNGRVSGFDRDAMTNIVKAEGRRKDKLREKGSPPFSHGNAINS